MLTKRQNLLETIHGGNPDRYVNQFEAFYFLGKNPVQMRDHNPQRGDMNIVNYWGVTRSWPEEMPGPFPVHTEEKIVCKDISKWQKYVKAPEVLFPAEEWEDLAREVEAVDRDEYFVTAMVAPGIFEQAHFLCEIQNTLMYFYEEPEALKELFEYIGDWEMRYVEQMCKYLKPDAIFQHDDWGSQNSTFFSPDMFKEFLYPVYKKVYGFYRAQGVKLIVHHSDSYAATLVPFMIDLGIDIWQGVMTSNDPAALIKEYGGQISFMGGIDSASVDHPGWTTEEVKEQVCRACDEYGKLYYIPCATQGGAMSTFPGVYEELTRQIAAKSAMDFK